MKYKTPRGTRDFLPEDMALRQRVMGILASIYKLFGFKEWDGPAFEYMETLTRKSREEIAGEIYTFQDKAGRNLGLRFELTASIARIVASRPNLRKPFKVYNIGKVWRYEKPQAGRYREFLQADADIFGSSLMTCEVELILMTASILEKLGLKEYTFLLNNRKILEAQLRASGITTSQQQIEALRALDKLSKIGEDGIRSEFVSRNIPPEKFDRLMNFIAINGSNTQKLGKTRQLFKEDSMGVEGVNELEEIITLLGESNLKIPVEISLSLVRGLDYYTGPIFETHSKAKEEIGSFAGGGRYDELVELFGGQPTPAVGISFGVERLIEIVIGKTENAGFTSPVKVFVAYTSPELLSLVLKAVRQFREAGIPAEYDLLNRKLGQQLTYANVAKIPYTFIILSQNEQKLKDMVSGQENLLSVEEAIQRLSSL